MNEIQNQTQQGEVALQAWRMLLAGLEGEHARLIAKHNKRITELKKAIEELEKLEKQKLKLADKNGVTEKPKRTRKANAPKGKNSQ